MLIGLPEPLLLSCKLEVYACANEEDFIDHGHVDRSLSTLLACIGVVCMQAGH